MDMTEQSERFETPATVDLLVEIDPIESVASRSGGDDLDNGKLGTRVE